eukprot:scaffold73_cov252-Pinguiococcus_pyrenoidosus.AAC.1
MPVPCGGRGESSVTFAPLWNLDTGAVSQPVLASASITADHGSLMMLKCKTSDEKTGLAHSGRDRAVDSTSQSKARLTWASIVRCPDRCPRKMDSNPCFFISSARKSDSAFRPCRKRASKTSEARNDSARLPSRTPDSLAKFVHHVPENFRWCSTSLSYACYMFTFKYLVISSV